MRKIIDKNEKGITLIALVITIIVLLILAGVAISMLSGENGILRQAANAKTQTDLAQLSESINLAATTVMTSKEHKLTEEEFKNELEKHGYKISEEDGTITHNNQKYAATNKGAVKATIDDLKDAGASVNVDTKLTDESGDTIVVPARFKIKSDSPVLVYKGIVAVAPDGSEFVWVPVTDVTKMATEMTNYGQGTTSYREPSLVTGDSADTYAVLEKVTGTDYDANSSYYNTILGYRSAIEFGKAMQEDYNEMVESVKNNKGFYIGRYETSINETTSYAQSISGVAPATASKYSANMWYGLYKIEKEYSSKTI